MVNGTKNLAVKNLKQALENGQMVLRLRYLFVVITTAVGVLFVIHILKFQTYQSIHRKVYMENPSSDYSHISDQVTQKLILMWTPFFNDWHWLTSNETTRICPLLEEQVCQVTTDPNDFVDAHAVLFHWNDVKIASLPPKKEPQQKWILINYESPRHVHSKSVASILGPLIDWTVSYRLDSDFHAPYGRIRPKKPDEQIQIWNEISEEEFNYKKLVVWAVSHCHTSSQREKFVGRMRKNMTVDIIGTCSKSSMNFLCRRGRTHRFACYKKLAKRYKFYLSFENSLCQDYVTEKFFLPLKLGMVPVVMGGADYSKIAPEGSYINALDFESPEDLAEYLKEVGDNFTQYQSFFKWRQDYVVDFADLANPKSRFWICEICSTLHLMDSKPEDPIWKTKKHKDVTNWWFKEGDCWTWPSGWNIFLKKASKKLTNTLGGPLYKFMQG